MFLSEGCWPHRLEPARWTWVLTLGRLESAASQWRGGWTWGRCPKLGIASFVTLFFASRLLPHFSAILELIHLPSFVS
jgi:hypothetical protein